MTNWSLKISDTNGEMHELIDSILTIKFRGMPPPLNISLLPLVTPTGMRYLRKSTREKDLPKDLRHHHESSYDSEWEWLREWRKRDRVHLDVWHAVAFALCAQCAAEEALVFDFVGECGHELLIRRWISQKAREHGRCGGIEGVGDDFLNVIKDGVRSGTIYYSRVEHDIEFVVFGECTQIPLEIAKVFVRETLGDCQVIGKCQPSVLVLGSIDLPSTPKR